MKLTTFLVSSFSALSLCALNTAFDVHNQNVQVGGMGRVMGSQKIKNGSAEGSHLHYSDATGYATYSHHLGPENVLSLQAGYQHIRINWKENPRFTGSNYNYADFSVGFLSDYLKDWRWFLNLGVLVDSDNFNFGHTGVWYGVMWGRLNFNDRLGFHVGFLGQVGVKNAYTLPVIGFDFKLAEKWKLAVIFPFDGSIAYLPTKATELGLRFVTYGGLYKMPYRAKGGIGAFDDGIFSIYSKSLNLYYAVKLGERLYWDISGGYNFGGWILSKDSQNHHGIYYKFKSAPSGTTSLILNF